VPAAQNIAPFYLTGPTASGKSGVAVALAECIGGEIVNADAFQLYRGLDTLTAKPSRVERERVPHHLYDAFDPESLCDAQRYRELALPVIADIAGRGIWPIVVGGSGLYIKALSHGLAELPKGDESLRVELRALPLDEKVRRLLALDPEAVQNVPLANPRYVERALEICMITGKPQSVLRQNFAQTEPWGSGVVLSWEREALYARINQRVLAMLDAGVLTEVAAFDGKGGLERAIGVRELRAHLAGECTLAEAVVAMQQATRRYAKRQGTWFRRETWLQTICLDSTSTPESAASHLIDLFPCLKSPPSPPTVSTSI
jgi:tRNA dimethylallyltransferase